MDKKIDNLEQQLKDVRLRKDELSEEVNRMNIIGFKIEGALEVLQDLQKETESKDTKNKKKEEKSD